MIFLLLHVFQTFNPLFNMKHIQKQIFLFNHIFSTYFYINVYLGDIIVKTRVTSIRNIDFKNKTS